MSQHLIDVLAEQRNEALNKLAQAEARARVLAEAVTRLEAENTELKEKAHGLDATS